MAMASLSLSTNCWLLSPCPQSLSSFSCCSAGLTPLLRNLKLSDGLTLTRKPLKCRASDMAGLSKAATAAAEAIGIEPICLDAVPAPPDMKQFVKSKLPGGIAAQELLGTGRRKRAVARVALVEGRPLMARQCFYVVPLILACIYQAWITFISNGTVLRRADIIYKNASIWTAESKTERMDSMSVYKGRILHVGSFADVQGTAGPETVYVDLEGRFVTPGFIDSHLHFLSGGLQLTRIDLRKTTGQTIFQEKLRNAAKGLSKGTWIIGGGWNNEDWGGNLPNASWIDDCIQGHPVWLTRIDGHMGLANTLAFRLAGINETTRSPSGGIIARDRSGVPTGLLVDKAMQLILSATPKPSLEERRSALMKASKLSVSRGVTSVVDFGSFYPGASIWDDFYEVYKWADETASMLIRITLFFPLETWERVVDLIRQKSHQLSPWLLIGGVKSFADGSLGSSTALFKQPYEDDRTNHGVHVADPDWLAKTIHSADLSKLQVAVHAIGDAANDEVISIMGSVIANNPPWDRRFRVEHAQHLSSLAPELFAKHGVIASMQPEHLLDDALYAERKLGERRALDSFKLRSLLDNGVQVALGSDWPVAPVNPLGGVDAAVRRTPPGFDTPWIPSESISTHEAFMGYTMVAAYAARLDYLIGSLSPGKLADFVVLSHDPLINTCNEMPQVLATYVGGKLVYSRTP